MYTYTGIKIRSAANSNAEKKKKEKKRKEVEAGVTGSNLFTTNSKSERDFICTLFYRLSHRATVFFYLLDTTKWV